MLTADRHRRRPDRERPIDERDHQQRAVQDQQRLPRAADHVARVGEERDGQDQRDERGASGQGHRFAPSARRRHAGEDRVEHAVGGRALELELGTDQQPVSKGRLGHRLDLVGRDDRCGPTTRPTPWTRAAARRRRGVTRRAPPTASPGSPGTAPPGTASRSARPPTASTSSRARSRSATPATGRTPAAITSWGSRPRWCRSRTAVSCSKLG